MRGAARALVVALVMGLAIVGGPASTSADAAGANVLLNKPVAACPAGEYGGTTCSAVNDGNDGTREVVAELARTDHRIAVLGDSRRGGKGLAIRSGVVQARGQIIGFADADNKVPIAETDQLLPWLDRGYDIVIGSRGLADSQVEIPAPLHRRPVR